jgi:hypothetical protein
MSNRIEQMKNIQSTALDLFMKKNTDYGDAFSKYGIIGLLIRIQDKIQRALSITSNNINLVEDESMSDTMLDLHNYAAMALMLMEEGKSDNCVGVTTDINAIDVLELDNDDEDEDEDEYREYIDSGFNPYISTSYPFQFNKVEYDNDYDNERYENMQQEV